MRLEGSLDAFSLPDIFQLLSFTKKTGALHLRRPGLPGLPQLHGVVFVTTGALTGGNSDVRRHGLARRLIGTGQLDDGMVTAAVDAAQNDPDLGVGRALQREGMDEELLHTATTEHVYDTVFDLLRWPDGEFAFVVDETNPDDVGVSVPVEDAVTGARQRLETWAAVSLTIPSPDAVLALVLAPAEDPSLSRDEWALLALIDGTRPVRDIVDITGRGEYAVVSALASLVDRGLVHVATAESPSAVPALVSRLSILAGLEGGPAVEAVEAAEPVEQPVAAEPAYEPIDPSVAEEFSELAAAGTLDAPLYDDPGMPDQRFGEPEPAMSSVPSMSGVVEEIRTPADDVVPARPEPFLARRRPEHPETVSGPVASMVGSVDGTSAVAPEVAPALIERDPSVNKSLLLRLIAGVRGL